MAFMKPHTTHMIAYLVETNAGIEVVPEDVCGVIDLTALSGIDRDSRKNEWEYAAYAHFQDYLEGSVVLEVERVEGWFSRLSAAGYLDCTPWMGPYETEKQALKELCEFYQVDENGDDLFYDMPELED